MAATVNGLEIRPWGSDSKRPRNAEAGADIVFVHGLGGDITTWGKDDEESPFWPPWLAHDLDEAKVWVVEYDSKMFARQKGADPHPTDRASSLLDGLHAKGIGQRPLMWVAHSLGGLMVKQIMRLAADSGDSRYRPLFASTKAAVFIATPHTGSSLANLAEALPTLFGRVPEIGAFLAWISAPSQSVESLKQDNPWIRNLTGWYRNQAVQRKILTGSYFEGKPYKALTLLVGEGSADPGVPGCVPVFVDADHVEISKPRDRESAVYRGVAKIAREFLDQVLAGTRKPVFPFGHAVKRLEEWEPRARTSNLKPILRTMEGEFKAGTLGPPTPEQERFAEKSAWDLDAVILYTLNRLRHEEESRNALDHIRHEYLRLRGEVSRALSSEVPAEKAERHDSGEHSAARRGAKGVDSDARERRTDPSLIRLYYALESYSALAGQSSRDKLLKEIAASISDWSSKEGMTRMDEDRKTRRLVAELLEEPIE